MLKNPIENASINKSPLILKNTVFTVEKEEVETKNFEQRRSLIKKKMIYDSYSDEENEDDYDPIFNINFESMFGAVWKVLIQIITIYSVILIPIQIAFSVLSLNILILNILIDIFFIVDIILNFFAPYYDAEETKIIKLEKISKHYLSSRFIIDMISALPFNSVLDLNQYLYYYEIKDYSTSHRITLYKLSRVVKIVNIIKDDSPFTLISYVFDKIDVSSTLGRFLYVFSYYLLILHVTSCTWIFIGKSNYNSWINNFHLKDSSIGEIYVSSLYFVFTSVLAIGYGDLVAINVYERTFNLFLLIFGAFMYSFAISSLSNILHKTDNKVEKFKANMIYLDSLKAKYSLKSKIFKKISRYLKSDISINKIDHKILMNDLPNSLKNQLLLTMYDDVVSSFLFFKHTDNIDFITRVLSCFQSIKFYKGDVLINQGDFIGEVIFVKKGVLTLDIRLYEDNCKIKQIDQEKGIDQIEDDGIELNGEIPLKKHRLKIIEIRRNEHFGDIPMFLNMRSPLDVRVKSNIVQLFFMKKIDLITISTDFPLIFEKIYKNSSYNMIQIEKLIKSSTLNLKQKIKRFSTIKQRKNFMRSNCLNSAKNVSKNFKNSETINSESMPCDSVNLQSSTSSFGLEFKETPHANVLKFSEVIEDCLNINSNNNPLQRNDFNKSSLKVKDKPNFKDNLINNLNSEFKLDSLVNNDDNALNPNYMQIVQNSLDKNHINSTDEKRISIMYNFNINNSINILQNNSSKNQNINKMKTIMELITNLSEEDYDLVIKLLKETSFKASNLAIVNNIDNFCLKATNISSDKSFKYKTELVKPKSLSRFHSQTSNMKVNLDNSLNNNSSLYKTPKIIISPVAHSNSVNTSPEKLRDLYSMINKKRQSVQLANLDNNKCFKFGNLSNNNRLSQAGNNLKGRTIQENMNEDIKNSFSVYDEVKKNISESNMSMNNPQMFYSGYFSTIISNNNIQNSQRSEDKLFKKLNNIYKIVNSLIK